MQINGRTDRCLLPVAPHECLKPSIIAPAAVKNGDLLITNKITVAASEVRVNDHIYNGTGTNAHPTFAWETVTDVRSEDGLILLITGNPKGLHGEFWLEPDEQIVVIRYPEPPAANTSPAKAKGGHGHT